MLLDARLRERGGALQEAPAGTFGFCATVERIFVDRSVRRDKQEVLFGISNQVEVFQPVADSKNPRPGSPTLARWPPRISQSRGW